MHDSALTRSDGSVFPYVFDFWTVRLLVLAVMVFCVHWICCIDLAQATETTSMSPVSTAENQFGKGAQLESQRTLAKKLAELNKRYEEQKKELIELQEEYERLRVSRRVRWYLLGSAVFLVGWIIGFSARRKSKRYSLEA